MIHIHGALPGLVQAAFGNKEVGDHVICSNSSCGFGPVVLVSEALDRVSTRCRYFPGLYVTILLSNYQGITISVLKKM